jgi:hypothetical protein
LLLICPGPRLFRREERMRTLFGIVGNLMLFTCTLGFLVMGIMVRMMVVMRMIGMVH